ncbi:MAG TPA: hypothetical protein VGF69_19550 [Thermoanaerobaculia bacterium]|jgi:hypothetical protein
MSKTVTVEMSRIGDELAAAARAAGLSLPVYLEREYSSTFPVLTVDELRARLLGREQVSLSNEAIVELIEDETGDERTDSSTQLSE